MADQSDIEQAIVDAVAAILYPGGQPSAAQSGGAVRVYRGAPVPAALTADMAADVAHVAVMAVPDTARAATRFPDRWILGSAPRPTLAARVDGTVVTFEGAADPGQIAAILVDGRGALCRTRAGDTPATVAQRTAADLAAMREAVAAGASVMLPSARRIVARVFTDADAVRETRRVIELFRLTVYAPGPDQRDRIGAALESGMAELDFLPMPDNTTARIRFAARGASDREAAAGVFIRQISYAVDYATTTRAMLPRLAIGGTAFSLPAGVNEPAILS